MVQLHFQHDQRLIVYLPKHFCHILWPTRMFCGGSAQFCLLNFVCSILSARPIPSHTNQICFWILLNTFCKWKVSIWATKDYRMLVLYHLCRRTILCCASSNSLHRAIHRDRHVLFSLMCDPSISILNEPSPTSIGQPVNGHSYPLAAENVPRSSDVVI